VDQGIEQHLKGDRAWALAIELIGHARGQVSASGIARHHYRARRCAEGRSVGERPSARGLGVEHLAGERGFRRQAIIDGNDARAGAFGKRDADGVVRVDIAANEPAAVEKYDERQARGVLWFVETRTHRAGWAGNVEILNPLKIAECGFLAPMQRPQTASRLSQRDPLDTLNKAHRHVLRSVAAAY
jgi:hypothetical protein